MRRAVFISCFLILATVAAYWQLRLCGFLNFDDPVYVTNNPRVFRGLNWEGIKWAFTTFHGANWHPLTWLSHMLDCQIFGDRPGAQHLVNLALHTCNALLLFWNLQRMTGLMVRSACVAALFALHPLHVESVAWISERKDVLSTLFFMLTLWAYTRYAKVPSSQHKAPFGNRRTVWYILALVFFAFGLLSKPMLVSVPFVLLLLDYWPLGRVSKARTLARPWWPLVREKLPYFALAIVSSVVTCIAQAKGGAIATEETVPFTARIPNALVTYAMYLVKMVWPAKLSVFYPHPITWPIWPVLGAVVLLLSISVLALRTRAWRPYLFVGWFWYVGTLVPVIGLIQVGSQARADRYTYIPLIGVFVMVVWTVADLVARRPKFKTTLGLGTSAALAACVIATHFQVRHWRNSVTLFSHALRIDPQNPVAHHSLGQALSADGDQAAAIQHFEEALRLRPDYYQAHGDLGNSLNLLGQMDQAISHYNQAIDLEPNYELAYYHLGNALVVQGRLHPAETNFLRALQLNPRFTEAHVRLANLFVMQNRLDEAMPHYQAATTIRPDSAEARYYFGAALARQKKFAEATEQFQESLAFRPDDAATLNDLAWIRATSEDARLRDVPKAVHLAQRACDLEGRQNPKYLDTLAVAYSEARRFAEAIATTKQAVAAAEATRQTNLAAKIGSRLPFYSEGRSYREMETEKR